MIERSINAHERNIIKYPVGPISDEHKSYIRNGKRMEALTGNHDDTVMSLAFAFTVSPLTTGQSPLNIPSVRYG